MSLEEQHMSLSELPASYYELRTSPSELQRSPTGRCDPLSSTHTVEIKRPPLDKSKLKANRKHGQNDRITSKAIGKIRCALLSKGTVSFLKRGVKGTWSIRPNHQPKKPLVITKQKERGKKWKPKAENHSEKRHQNMQGCKPDRDD
jgi:hypothetical protein